MSPLDSAKAALVRDAMSGGAAHRRSLPRMFAAGCIVIAGVAVLIAIFARTLTPDVVTSRDYIQYWAAGRQLAHHADPYDVGAIFALERQSGMRADDPKVSVSPPLALELALPLGWVSPKTGLIAWLMAELGAVLLSMWLLWRLAGKPDSRLHLLSLAFAPVVACQMAGQIGAFFLLCLVLFLALRRSRPFVAGVVLIPLLLKPHLFVLFAIALMVWCVARRNFAILAGGVCALAASCAWSLAIDPQAFTQYARLTSSVPMMDWPVPTAAFLLRNWIDPAARWIGFAPEAAGCVWAAWFAWKRRGDWDWMREGQLVLLVSVVCSPYSWISDQCVVLPAVLAVLLSGLGNRRALLLFLLLDSVMLAELFLVPKMTSNWFIWTAPAWLAWYLYVTHSQPAQPTAAMA